MILCGMLGFCGCGNPTAALEFIGKVLHHVDWVAENLHPFKGEEWDVARARHKANGSAIFGPTEGVDYFVYYVLTEKRFLEHGGSVPGWLTESGHMLMALIDEWRELEEGE